ncbi:Multiple RNA-binding domain-containing protein 1 [Malassezia yamatoensis]|uniref:Multiple RNA-binding domain-containing protein 1 n=1 Tax=Malassezia yamatoensis TaxID=253288 RepID=A0AAJ5YRI2_9BASI|nr:Multiple RNA-binding domain-containing protein 1 [Malassezia yamatoensis]
MSSRLIVKGLPAYLTDARLREHFSQKGSVTDAKLMRRPDGTSRRFGFVGYRSEEEAKSAQLYFDRTYIDTSRISVSIAKQIGHEELQKQQSAKRGNSENASVEPKREKKRKSEPNSTTGASFEEFLSVMLPKNKQRSWQNSDDIIKQDVDSRTDKSEVPTIPSKPRKEKKSSSQDLEQAPNAAPSDGAAVDEELTDLEYMRRRMRHKVAGEEEPKAFEQSDTENESESSESEAEPEEIAEENARRRAKLEEEQRKEEENVDTIMQSSRLFVRNLPFSATEEDLEKFFSSYGTVSQVHIPLDPESKASKGLAFVSYADPAHALLAYRGRNGAIFQGRLLHVIPAVDLKPKPETSATLKQKRKATQRANASKDFNWSMLYMNSDAVAASISDRLGVSKSDILNPEESSTSAAVRLALAETRIIQETKQFFEQHGMNLEAFEKDKSRSDDTILVKNIPYGTSGEEIRALFENYGSLARVMIPPSNTIAVVEMPIPGEARAAFRALAYKRFKDSVLYLEKAPISLLPTRNGDEKQTISATQGIAAPESSQTLLAPDSSKHDDESSQEEAAATLYIKNLNFATTSEKLASHFRAMDGFVFARVQTKPDPKRPGAHLSLGYGFVGFRTADAAQVAQRAMNGHLLDGHTLAVAFAKRGHDTDITKPQPAPSTKMLVKNVPFEATKKDIRELFSAHGQLKSVRLPRQIHGRVRGFGFVEFVSRREAETAMAALKHTHLLGRHLVLEWAGTEDGDAAVKELREKTRKAYVTEQERSQVTGQRQRIRLGTDQINDALAQQSDSE